MSTEINSSISSQQQQVPAHTGEITTGSIDGYSTLDNCKPHANHQLTDSQSALDLIRSFQRDEAFTRVCEQETYAVVIHRKLDAQGYYRGEDYHPIPAALQSQVGALLRFVTFHACLSQSGLYFILAQKKDSPGAPPNSWNQSLAQALKEPPGQWLKIWSDSLAQRYQYELVQPQVEGTPEYPDFAEHLENALSPNIITGLDHPIIQQILGGRGAGNDMEEVY